MKNNEKYKRIALFIDSLVLLTWLTSTFGIVWINFYNLNITFNFFRRGNWVLFILYFLISYIFSKIYNGLKVGHLKTGDIIFSQILAMICTNIVTYLQICLIGRAILDPRPLILVMAYQAVVITIWAIISNSIFKNLYPAKNMVIIFGNTSAQNLIDKMSKRSDKYNITCSINVKEGFEFIKEHIVDYDGVIICDTPNEIRNDILKFCFNKSIRTYLVPKISDIIVRGSDEVELFDTPLISSKNQGLSVEQLFIKRTIDIILSFIGIVITSPFMLLAAAMIKLYDRGPILYKQERLTINGKVFKLYKFRSMIVNAEKDGIARLSTENDKRITPVGKFIRKVRLDELPQLFNILKGDMSIVGPRPERPEISEKYEEEMPEFSFRLKVKAGLTGNAQIIGKYNTTPYDKLKLDLMYIERYTLVLDFLLILKTIKIIFMPESTEGVKEGYITPITSELTSNKDKEKK